MWEKFRSKLTELTREELLMFDTVLTIVFISALVAITVIVLFSGCNP